MLDQECGHFQMAVAITKTLAPLYDYKSVSSVISLPARIVKGYKTTFVGCIDIGMHIDNEELRHGQLIIPCRQMQRCRVSARWVLKYKYPNVIRPSRNRGSTNGQHLLDN